MRKLKRSLLFVALALLVPVSIGAYDVNEKLSIEMLGTGVSQYGAFDETDNNIGDTGRGAFVVDLGANFHPTDVDEFNALISFAAGNALNKVAEEAGFTLAPYFDNLEDDLKNINGRDRDYLLTAWYKHTFAVGKESFLGVTGGLIDSTDYLDDNAFANDENFQFMNEVFVNSPVANLPLYDVGAAAEFEWGDWHVRGVWMNSKTDEVFDKGGPNEAESNRSYNYVGGQVGFRVETDLGEGNYRVYGYATTREFISREVTSRSDLKRLGGIGISADQALSQTVGLFARLGWQEDDAEKVNHKAAYSGGLKVSGKLWRRGDDNAGLGFAYLDGADGSDLRKTLAFEGYARFQLIEYVDLSFDVQWLKEDRNRGNDPTAWILSGRLNAYF
ncbi:MAG: carbohydrate porin [Candidatus Hydrogenedentota bacterium]|nr:MAG: carbohydrate porin [Candidatus Hydrogenedentota bacterium]